MITEIKGLETIAGEGWRVCPSASDYASVAAGYGECTSVKKVLGKYGIPSKIIYDAKAVTQNKFQIYVPKEQYEKAAEIAKKGA